MDAQPTVTVSRRWTQPEEVSTGIWAAQLHDPDSAGLLERRAYGPDAAACARETERQDLAWVASAARAGDQDKARERLRLLLEDHPGDTRTLRALLSEAVTAAQESTTRGEGDAR